MGRAGAIFGVGQSPCTYKHRAATEYVQVTRSGPEVPENWSTTTASHSSSPRHTNFRRCGRTSRARQVTVATDSTFPCGERKASTAARLARNSGRPVEGPGSAGFEKYASRGRRARQALWNLAPDPADCRVEKTSASVSGCILGGGPQAMTLVRTCSTSS